MDNDEKSTSRDDEIPLHDKNEAKEATEEDDKFYPPYEEFMSETTKDNDSGNMISPKKPSGKDDASRVEPDFGMPDFGFPEEFRPMPSLETKPAKNSLTAARARLESPLDKETGWESNGNIELPPNFEELGNRSDSAPADDQANPQERNQAKVMPFPGSALPRVSEPEPSEMLRGFGSPGKMDLFASQQDEPAETLPDFDPSSHDAIADAVQSALKNVYGGPPAESDEDDNLGRYTVAESLRLAAAAEVDPSNWNETNRDWDNEHPENYYESEQGDNPEINPEAILDNLYGNRRGGMNEEPGRYNMAPRDYDGTEELNRDWPDDIGVDGRNLSRNDAPDYAPPSYRDQRQPYEDYRGNIFGRDPDYPGEQPHDTEWGRPPYLTPGMPRGQYPMPIPMQNQESLAAGAPDSSHLLGAAGLGLIGGIALAGVLAVFVFNSFVDEGQPTSVAEAPPKVVERLDGPATAAPPIAENTIASTEQGPETQPEIVNVTPPQPETVPDEPLSGSQDASPSGNLIVTDISGEPGQAISLKISLAETADPDVALISLKGLPDQAKLSIGIDVGGGQWLLPPSRLDELTVTAPEDTAGGYNLEAQLLQEDAQTPLSDPVSFKLTLGTNLEQSSATNSVSGSEEGSALALSDQAAQLAEVSEGTTQISTDFLTQMLIRDGNKLMRDGQILSARRLYEQASANGNPEAALAMGRSYDPSYFEKLPIKTGKPDPAAAFQWYKKALDGGLVTARVKIDGLKQWLQR